MALVTKARVCGIHGFVLATLMWCISMLGPADAREVAVVTWDRLLPANMQLHRTPGSAPEQGNAAPSSHSQLMPSSAKSFDPLNDGFLPTEDWEPQSKAVSSAVLNKDILIDGYVLPLKKNDARVVDFLLVPWVGACIHMPSPPPNQIVHVSYPEGLILDKQFEAVRLAGVLQHVPVEHDLYLIDGQRKVPASYALQNARVSGSPEEIIAASTADLPKLAQLQIWVNSLFTDSMQNIGEDGSLKTMLVALLMSFGYGALHTLGPGHGKSVVISYFVGTGGSLSRGLVMGARIAVIHVLSAVIVVGFLDLVVRQATGSAPSDYRTIRLGSYTLIMIIGATMLWQAVVAVRKRRAELASARMSSKPSGITDAHAHHHTHDHSSTGCAACAAAAPSRGSGWIAASVGVVPCTGALLVMLFGLANDLVWPAILMVVSISAGMAVAMSAIGVAAIWGRSLAEKRFNSESDRVVNFDMGARLVGSVSVLAIGALLFTVTISYPPMLQVPQNDFALQQESATSPGG